MKINTILKHRHSFFYGKKKYFSSFGFDCDFKQGLFDSVLSHLVFGYNNGKDQTIGQVDSEDRVGGRQEIHYNVYYKTSTVPLYERSNGESSFVISGFKPFSGTGGRTFCGLPVIYRD